MGLLNDGEMGWFEIYYRDGFVYSSEVDDGEPPPFGVEIIAQPDEDYEVYFDQGNDFYYWYENRWWGTGWDGIYQVLVEDWGVLRPTVGVYHEVLVDSEWVKVDAVGLIKYMVDTKKILLGRMVSNARFQEIFQVAKRNKLTFHPRERKP
jgi:hypothetical protein